MMESGGDGEGLERGTGPTISVGTPVQGLAISTIFGHCQMKCKILTKANRHRAKARAVIRSGHFS